MAEEIVNAGYLRDPETHEIFLPQTHESLVTGLGDKITNAIDALDMSQVSLGGAEHITAISETNGVVSVTKGDIQSASTSQKGIVQFVSDVHNSTDTEKTVTAKQVWDECAKRNVRFTKDTIIPDVLPVTENEFINKYAYGIRWPQNGSTVTRVGNPVLSDLLPIHNAFKACVYRIVPVSGGFNVTETINGTDYTINYKARREFMYWLNSEDWSKKEDGTQSCLTGEDMTGIAIWHPKFYVKSFDGVSGYNEVYISERRYDTTWIEIKEGYIDFAKMQTSANNGVTYARCFGNPNFTSTNPMTSEMSLSDYNTWIQSQYNSSIALPKSTVSLNRVTAHQYALNSGAHLMSYDEYKWIFVWLPAIEGATFAIENNNYFDWQDGSSTNIVMRDSLSTTPSFMYYGLYTANYSAITGTCGWNFIPAGYTNVLGSHTGWVKVKLPNSGGTYDSKIVSRWRGFEIQRNIWTNLFGVNPVNPNVSGVCDIYTSRNRALWDNNMPITISSTSYTDVIPWNSRSSSSPEYTTKTGWNYVGTQLYSGYGQEFDLGSTGECFFKSLNGSYAKYDYSYGYLNNANPRWFLAGGDAGDGAGGGPFCFSSDFPAGNTDDIVGFRCCWNADEYTSVLN